jgi:hypothetical protein
MHGGLVLALLLSTANHGWVGDGYSVGSAHLSEGPVVAEAVIETPLTPPPLEAPGVRCGAGNLAAEGEHAGVVVGDAPHWYDASSTTTRGYSVRGTSATSLGMLIYRWDGASTCLATSGAFSDAVRADFSLPPGLWQISMFANGASPGTYVLLGGRDASFGRDREGA